MQPPLPATCLPTLSKVVLTTSKSIFNSSTSSIYIMSVCEATPHKLILDPSKSFTATQRTSTTTFKPIAIRTCSHLSCPLARQTSTSLSVVTAWYKSSPQLSICLTIGPSSRFCDSRLRPTACSPSNISLILVGQTCKNKDWRALRIWPISLSRPIRCYNHHILSRIAPLSRQ